MRFRAWHAPVRLATGAFILNSGMSKLRAGDEERDKTIHHMASGAYPVFENLEPGQFTRLLAAGEVALGAALLAPFVSPGLAGLGLTAFSGGLIGLYLRTPGMRQEGGVRPTQAGTALAKDVWMLSIGAGLLTDAAADRLRRMMPGRS